MPETTAPEDDDRAPTTAMADDDQGAQPDPIVVPVADLLAREVGPLHDLDVELIDEWNVAWAGVDQAGQPVVGKLSYDFAVGDDGRSIVLAWNVVLDAAGT